MIREMVDANFGFINFASEQTLNNFTLPDNAVEVKTDNGRWPKNSFLEVKEG